MVSSGPALRRIDERLSRQQTSETIDHVLKASPRALRRPSRVDMGFVPAARRLEILARATGFATIPGRRQSRTVTTTSQKTEQT
jgi:hypothetical protein